MRDFKGMKRQRSRNRGGGSGGGKPQHNANRAFESNGPDGVKIRGAAQHVFEKYQQLARDALTAGDRVLGESYQQHAEHYFRVLRAVQPQRPPSDIIGRDAFTSGVDIDFEDEGGEGDTAQDGGDSDADRGEQRSEWRQEGRYEGRRDERPRDRNFNRDDRQRDERPRDDRPREERPREDRQRDERPRDDRPREERPREERQREDRPPREERQRDDRPRGERFREDRQRAERPAAAADPLPVVEPRAAPLAPEIEQPGSPILRSQDGGVSHAPAFLQAPRVEPKPEAAAEEAEPRPRTRRRRAPRSFEGAADTAEGSAPNADVAEEA
ncbi:MAG: DUF4167 domain-containing protein [Caulobacteraceae bacterium]|nr:DUF4167 domain-containing protein [Caulobacteraceae bacterium]